MTYDKVNTVQEACETELKARLEAAVDYAAQTGSFSKINIAEKSRWVCAFGLGRFFEEAFDFWQMEEKLHVNILCDNNPEKWGKEYHGLKCISPRELYCLEDVVVIPMVGDFAELERQLLGHGMPYIIPSDAFFEIIAKMPRDTEWFRRNKIPEVFSMLEDRESKELYTDILCNRLAQKYARQQYEEMASGGEYFTHNLYDLSEQEAFVDCGAYTGDTVTGFIAAVHEKFDHIYAFEMDNGNFDRLQETCRNMDGDLGEKITCIHAGVWNENSRLEYGKEEHGTGESFSLLKSENSLTVDAVKLDDALKARPVTFIKMDIEGAELNALKGARGIIQSQKPKLAICIYHKLNDFWEIPIYLKQLVPEYKLYIRHHQKNLGGTVLYAVCS